MALLRMPLLGLPNRQFSIIPQSPPHRLLSVLAHGNLVTRRSLETSTRMMLRVSGARNDEPATEVDVSVFRFTLEGNFVLINAPDVYIRSWFILGTTAFSFSIPGFDDGDLPRIVGTLFGSLLLVNHVVSIESMTSAQLTSEGLGLFLAAVAFSLPSFGRRLKGGEALKEGNKGPGRRSIFELARCLSNKQKQELAWSSYALLQNTKTSAMIVWYREEVVCVRGKLDLGPMSASGGSKALAVLQKMLNDTPSFYSSGPLYVSDGAHTKGWSIVPRDAKSVVVQPFEGCGSAEKGGLILVSFQPRSYSTKDRTWIAMLAQKILGTLQI